MESGKNSELSQNALNYVIVNIPNVARYFHLTWTLMAEFPKSASRPRKRFIGSGSSNALQPWARAILSNQIPDDILHDEDLSAAIRQLPSNYSFEIHKTIHYIRKNNVTMVGIQMPEGLQMFACIIADLIER